MPCTIVLFGATGDLARKKLIPALDRLDRNGRLHPGTRIIAIGRREWTTKQLLKFYGLRSALSRRITYHQLEFNDVAAYAKLRTLIEKGSARVRNKRFFYLATPPDAFPTIVKHLENEGIAQKDPEHGWHRVVFEKPFGSDLSSARSLNRTITKLFSEQQIYRIDHYVGKSFVQEILVLRLANPIFEFLWNNAYIDSVQIVVSETQGIGTRGGYYDNAGALRDMIQNHLMQVLALTAMEPPTSLAPEKIRDEKAKVLKDVRVTDGLVLGQYRAGDGIPSYTAEEGVRKGSQTETFAEVKLAIDNKRWRGVPFYLRTGKALKHDYAEIALVFKTGDWLEFKTIEGFVDQNVLVIRIQPDEGLKIRFNLTDHHHPMKVAQHLIDFCHSCEMGINTPEAYENLLEDAMQGDQTLFSRWDIVERSWKVIDALRKKKVKLHKYTAGSHGPLAAERMISDEMHEYIGKQIIGQHRHDKKR